MRKASSKNYILYLHTKYFLLRMKPDISIQLSFLLKLWNKTFYLCHGIRAKIYILVVFHVPSVFSVRWGSIQYVIINILKYSKNVAKMLILLFRKGPHISGHPALLQLPDTYTQTHRQTHIITVIYVHIYFIQTWSPII